MGNDVYKFCKTCKRKDEELNYFPMGSNNNQLSTLTSKENIIRLNLILQANSNFEISTPIYYHIVKASKYISRI